ncbi:hypothetical protein K435DRAFT_162425 [Dendrothele bispora CBS 962.96]|uniref:Uncharacterized protein n=1 Tax=Dendrothele bispora (strain CBS 962.96) TaxID=1314807 RepID=A0A4S8MP97_DENBC|nr:hypothetical protein K435DRAFT_162425 [Dendrothele bispora CBS 962.96]
MYLAKALKDGLTPGGKHASLDEMIMDAAGFADVFLKHQYEIVKRLWGLGHLCAMTDDVVLTGNDALFLVPKSVSLSKA